ncbi:hypothetical protein M9H77_19635 [Catharanthus roseus]|uniref:Uncharacterized protein n=1 Tax=Catharanthus roseus TaxID=4058 RepID=A0ACC0BAV6_CATRO|nr:hypothetical protein M9H77_19635 [Catharanthus roseus]
MELCTARAISGLPRWRLFGGGTTRSKQFRWQSNAWKITPSNFNPSGTRYFTNLTLKSSMSEETSSGTTLYGKDQPDGVITMEDTRPVEKEYAEDVQNKAPEETSSEENQAFELFEKLDLKIGSDDTYSILLLGGGGLAALYLAISIISAIDSVPLIPKLMELVGLSYTSWCSTRYLLFKKNREELAAKIEEIKQQVLGYDD